MTPLGLRFHQFPVSLGESENYADYRHIQQRTMRNWVVVSLGGMARTIDIAEAITVLEDIAAVNISRPLYGPEKRLLAEATRDVLSSIEAIYRRAEWLADYQEAHVGDMAS